MSCAWYLVDTLLRGGVLVGASGAWWCVVRGFSWWCARQWSACVVVSGARSAGAHLMAIIIQRYAEVSLLQPWLTHVIHSLTLPALTHTYPYVYVLVVRKPPPAFAVPCVPGRSSCLHVPSLTRPIAPCVPRDLVLRHRTFLGPRPSGNLRALLGPCPSGRSARSSPLINPRPASASPLCSPDTQRRLASPPPKPSSLLSVLASSSLVASHH